MSSIHIPVLHTCGSIAIVGWVGRRVRDIGDFSNVAKPATLAISNTGYLEIALKSHNVQVFRSIYSVGLITYTSCSYGKTWHVSVLLGTANLAALQNQHLIQY